MPPSNIADELRENIRSIAQQILTGTKRDIDMFAETMARRLEVGVREKNHELLREVGIGAHLLAEKHRLQARNLSMHFVSTLFQTVAQAAILGLTGPKGLISGAIGAIAEAVEKSAPKPKSEGER